MSSAAMRKLLRERSEMKATIKELKNQVKALTEENKQLKNGKTKEKIELEKMEKELGEKGGIGHFWENDRAIDHGGVRDEMTEEELKKVARAISLGQKEVNLKERVFLAFFDKIKQKQPRGVLVRPKLGGGRGWMDNRVQV